MDANSIQIQALVTFVMPFVIQLLKRSQAKSLAWIDQAKPKVCMATSAVTALLTAGGIHFVHTAGAITVTYPDLSTALHGLLTFLVAAIFQLAGQHALYDGFWRYIVASPSSQPATEAHQ